MRARRYAPVLTLAVAISTAACGLDHEQLRAASSPRHPSLTDATPVSGAPPLAAVPTALPDSLRCVSEPLEGGTNDVLRVDMWRDVDGKFMSTVQRGPQFWSHSGVWFGSNGEAWPEAVPHTLVEESKGGVRLVERSDVGTLTIALEEQEQGIFTGRFVDAQCYQHVEATLTCWNDVELFGSPWAGIEGSLAARFDWNTGTCANAAGEPAENDLPLAIVRETGFAECTTLTGRLNGDDFTYPDLVGWNLAGANLDGAELFFANLTFSTLNGADLTALEFGYATVSGSFDDATARPEQGECRELESPWGGATLECVR